ncbi:MAG: hypothetical protein ACI9YL_001219, partial [Luteibaculaceae bacterium]
EQLDELEVEYANIRKISHSRLEQIKKDTRIQAIKAAKEKADYLLEAIGQKTGKALQVQEVDYPDLRSSPVANHIMKSDPLVVHNTKVSTSKGELQFKKIKVRSSVFVKFAIWGELTLGFG